MTTVRSSSQLGRIVPGEWDIAIGNPRSWSGDNLPAVYCHGSGATAIQAFDSPGQNSLARLLAQRYLVSWPDLGGETWGNDTGVARIASVVSWLRARGLSRPVSLVSSSMGTLNALAYTLANPGEVGAVASAIPALDLADLHENHGPEFTALIDAAYPPSYDDATDGPTHNPVRFATALPADLSIGLFTSSDDPFTVPSTADEFVSLRPQTHRQDLGPVGHGDVSLLTAAPMMADWLRDVTVDQ